MNSHLLAGVAVIGILIALSASRGFLQAWRARNRYVRVARADAPAPARRDDVE